ncbi:MAG: branched-chain amino acid ABC transporter permease [Gammaproteobacteria bacterium]|jgi:ABC-type branched-subunit amino acid transport system permease subunit|nr:branched-chain amino acid ABC transporter permease [Gammaproteobacteria bacterium]MCP4881262.1 branched-chain amino acid ABC transporter permease [Gammaproteobacteria bacterium]MDP6165001.1 branched-chain amino acid ABC transporter permease [Gammaproteobacteria bacterium]
MKMQQGFFERNRSVFIFALIALTMPFWFPLIGGYSGLDTKIMVFCIFVVGFDLLLGYTGYLSFGHAAFFGIAAYTTGLMLKGFSDNIIPAIIVAVIVSTLVSVVIGLLTLKRTGIYFSILTLAFAEMFHSMAMAMLQQWTGGENGLTGMPTPMLFSIKMQGDAVFYFITFVAILMFYVAKRIERSPVGLMMRAIKCNQTRLEYTGINARKYKLLTFVISAAYAALAGALMVVYEPFVGHEFLGWHQSGEIVIMSVIGGVGTLVGPMLGAAFMLYFENVLSVDLGEQWLLVLGMIFMVVVIFMPGGFMEAVSRLQARFTQK